MFWWGVRMEVVGLIEEVDVVVVIVVEEEGGGEEGLSSWI